MIQRLMTVEEFAMNRSELPDGGQWAELVRGVPVTLEPPDVDHGNVVLNLSKAFATYVQETLHGYPCFDLGLHVQERPDTVLFPAASYFVEGERFAEADRDITATVPVLVVELVAAGARQMAVEDRVKAYMQRGTRIVWLIDPVQRVVHVVEQGVVEAKRISEFETLVGAPVLPSFKLKVSELFVIPEWAR